MEEKVVIINFGVNSDMRMYVWYIRGVAESAMVDDNMISVVTYVELLL